MWSVASKSLVSTYTGHANVDSYVDAVAAMPDGRRILSTGAGDVHVWQLLTGTLERTILRCPSWVGCTPRSSICQRAKHLLALPDNQHALSGSTDNTVKLFNVDDGALLRTFKHHTSTVYCLALLPDGRRFVSGSDDNTARIVEIGLAPQ